MSWLGQIRLASRALVQRPGLAVMVIGALTVALAFNVTAASVLTTLLSRPFPYRELDALLLVRDARPREGVHQGHAIAAADFLDLQTLAPAFARLTAWKPAGLEIAGAGSDPQQIEGIAATANFFDALGISAVAGRTWPLDADQPGHDAFVLISHRLWLGRFGADASVLGSEVRLNGRPVTLVGVIRDEDCYPAGIDAWVPLVLAPTDRVERQTQQLAVIGRLGPGASIDTARLQLDAVASRLSTMYPLTNQGRGFNVLPIKEEQYEFTAPLFGFVQGAAALVLLLALVDVTTVVIARTLEREPELAVRTMLGASRGSVMRLVVLEVGLAVAIAAALGVAASIPLLAAIRASLPEGIARWVNGWSGMRVDHASVGLGLALTLAAIAIIGIPASLAALRARSGTLSGTRLTRRRQWSQRAVVASQIGLAVTLVLCASVIGQGLGQIRGAFADLAPDRLLRFTVTSPTWRYAEAERVSEWHARLIDALAAVPGVRGVAIMRNEPASNVPNPMAAFDRDDAPARSAADRNRAEVQIVSAGTFGVLGLATAEGRGFLSTDLYSSAKVAVLSREAVRRFWPDRDPVGTTIRLEGNDASIRIVGIVADVKLNWYDLGAGPVIYLPDAQAPARSASVLLRADPDATAIAPAVHAAIRAQDPYEPIGRLEPLSVAIADSLSPIRIVERLLLVGAALAAVLAIVGIFGVLAQSVRQRRREFGVRMAMGATGRSIALVVAADGAWTAVAGLAVALGLAVPALRITRAWLLGLSGVTGTAISIAVAGAMAMVGIAAFWPARRASQVDVATLLRTD